MSHSKEQDFSEIFRKSLPKKAVDRWSDSNSIMAMSTVKGRLGWITLVGGYSKLEHFFDKQTVVSLGCGSPSSTYGDGSSIMKDKKSYEAWLPRLAWAYGAKSVFGLDVRSGDPADANIYQHKKADIIDLLLDANGIASTIGTRNIKLLDCNGVFGAGHASSPMFLQLKSLSSKDNASIREFERNLEQALCLQAENLLQDGGMLFYNYNLLRYKGKKWQLLYRVNNDWIPPVPFIDQTE